MGFKYRGGALPTPPEATKDRLRAVFFMGYEYGLATGLVIVGRSPTSVGVKYRGGTPLACVLFYVCGVFWWVS